MMKKDVLDSLSRAITVLGSRLARAHSQNMRVTVIVSDDSTDDVSVHSTETLDDAALTCFAIAASHFEDNHHPVISPVIKDLAAKLDALAPKVTMH